MLTSRRKLMLSLAALVMLGVLVSGFAAERTLRRDQLARIERALEARAGLVVEQIRGIPLEPRQRRGLDEAADRAGAAGQMRVTLIGPGGAVVGDSQVPLERLPGVANHAGRPEIRAALGGRMATAVRHSETVGRELLYLARPAEGGGVVRVAVDLSEVDAAVAALRARLAFAGVLGLLVAVALSTWISWYTLRPIREMQRVAAKIAGGHLDDRLPQHPDELGEISQAINQLADQLRLRLEEVTREKEQLHAVLESMVEGVLVVDLESTVLLANSRLREFYGTGGDIVGHPLLRVIRDADLDALLHEVAESGERVSRTLALGGRTPRKLRVQAARFPALGPPVGTVTVFHDVTELERLEEVRRDFVANASHELRTPLTAIHGFAETLLGDGPLSESERRSYLQIIDRHARRLGHIVNDLLALSTIETGKVKIEPTRVDVAQLVAGVVRDARARCDERGLRVTLRSEGPVTAQADPHALEQVVTNLLDNAIKYTEPGGSIEIEVHGDASRVRVAVRDSGIGIPEADLTRIFERFYRVDKARSRALGGTGLGLSIVKHLVQGMGGEISVQSRLGEGSTFSLSLPAAQARAA